MTVGENYGQSAYCRLQPNTAGTWRSRNLFEIDEVLAVAAEKFMRDLKLIAATPVAARWRSAAPIDLAGILPIDAMLDELKRGEA
jgi:hypothetical protein